MSGYYFKTWHTEISKDLANAEPRDQWLFTEQRGCRMRRYTAEEYTRIEGQPLSPARLAAIQRALPEQERFSFLLSLEATLADQVLAATVKLETPAQPAERNR
jgi:hypothetical protein